MTNLYAALNLTQRTDPLTRALDDVALLWAFGELQLDTAFELVRRARGVPRRALRRAWAQVELSKPRDHRASRRELRALFRACGGKEAV